MIVQSIEQTQSVEPDQTEQRPFWEALLKISAQIPDAEWDKIPADASLNLDRYLYEMPGRGK